MKKKCQITIQNVIKSTLGDEKIKNDKKNKS